MVAETVAQQEAIPLVDSDSMYADAKDEATPVIETETLGSLTIGHEFFDTIQEVGIACSKDETRPILTGVLFECKDGHVRLVATDTYRLLIRDIEPKLYSGIVSVDFEGTFIFPMQWVKKELPTVIKDSGGKKNFRWLRECRLEIVNETTIRTVKRREREKEFRYRPMTRGGGYNETKIVEHDDLVRVPSTCQVAYLGNNRQYRIQLIDGQFVNYTKVTPDLSEAVAQFHLGKDFGPALEWMKPISDVDCCRVAICTGATNRLQVDYEADGNVHASYPIFGDLQGEPFKIAFNCRNMHDFTKAIGPAACPTLHYFGYKWETKDWWNRKQDLQVRPQVICVTSDDTQYWIMPMCLPGELEY